MSLSRLEATASRFEDVAETIALLTTNGASHDNSAVPVSGGQAPAPPTASGSTATHNSGDIVDPLKVEFVSAYQADILTGKLKPFMELTKGFAGPNVVELVCPSP